MYYDFDSFLSSVKYLDREDILAAAYKEHKLLDKPFANFNIKARIDLQQNISGLLYWLENQQKSPSMHDRDFEKLKPICESLIRKEQLPTEALELFVQE